MYIILQDFVHTFDAMFRLMNMKDDGVVFCYEKFFQLEKYALSITIENKILAQFFQCGMR